jgi:hypothetical protein
VLAIQKALALLCVVGHALEINDDNGFVTDHPGIVSRGMLNTSPALDVDSPPPSIFVTMVPEIW